jgi:YD repeat-containing protein
MRFTGHWVYDQLASITILSFQSSNMKRILLLPLLLLAVSVFAQPTPAEIKKYKIKKLTELTNGQDGSDEKFWYYDRRGYDSIKGNLADTATFYHTFKNGKLVKKLVALSQDPSRDNVDEYVYEYNSDGSYKITYRDGAFGMKSYEWFDAKGRMQKSQSPDGNTSTYKYNAAGKLIAVTSDGKNNGMKISHKYIYNPKAQLVKKEMDVDGTKSVITYEYNTKGQLIKEMIKGGWEGEDSETTTSYEYNEKGIIRKKMINSNGSTITIDYSYEYH